MVLYCLLHSVYKSRGWSRRIERLAGKDPRKPPVVALVIEERSSDTPTLRKAFRAHFRVWIALTLLFGVWLNHAVEEEFRLGIRTSADGDSIVIPIGGFAMWLALRLVVVSGMAFLIRA